MVNAIARWSTSVDAIDLDDTPSHLFTRSWLRAFGKSLVPETAYLTLELEPNRTDAVAPFMHVNGAEYKFFVPRELLAELLARANSESLRRCVLDTAPAAAFVCAIPFAYQSPLSRARSDLVPSIIEECEREVARRKLEACAFLYLEEEDSGVFEMFEKAGYGVVALDANAVLEIDPGWLSLDDYFMSHDRGRNFRREHRRFLDAGYDVGWVSGLPDVLISELAPLEHAFLCGKGIAMSTAEVAAWYDCIKHATQDTTWTLVVRRGETLAGFVVFVRDRDRLIGKAIGKINDANAFLYFNLACYLPIQFAIANRVRRIDLGPASARAKRLRGAKGYRLYGAFRFSSEKMRSMWPEIRRQLSDRVDCDWHILCPH